MKSFTVAATLLSFAAFSVAAPTPVENTVEMEKRYCIKNPIKTLLGIAECAPCSGICPEKRDFIVEVEKRSSDSMEKRFCFVNPLTGKSDCAKCTPGHACPLKRSEGWIPAEMIEMEKRYCIENPIESLLGIAKCAPCSSSGICPEKRDYIVEVERRSFDPLEKRFCFVNPLTGKSDCAKCTPGHACPLKRADGWVQAEMIEMEKRYCIVNPIASLLGTAQCGKCTGHICPEKRDFIIEVEKRSTSEDLEKRFCIANPLTGVATCAKCAPGHACPLKREEGWTQVELLDE